MLLHGLLILLAFQLMGDVVVHVLHLSVPGPVMGLVGLAATLAVVKRTRRFGFDQVSATRVGQAATGLLAVLGVLFVPAGVGIMQEYGLLLAHGVSLLLILGLSTLIAMLATVGMFLLVARFTGSGAE